MLKNSDRKLSTVVSNCLWWVNVSCIYECSSFCCDFCSAGLLRCYVSCFQYCNILRSVSIEWYSWLYLSWMFVMPACVSSCYRRICMSSEYDVCVYVSISIDLSISLLSLMMCYACVPMYRWSCCVILCVDCAILCTVIESLLCILLSAVYLFLLWFYMAAWSNAIVSAFNYDLILPVDMQNHDYILILTAKCACCSVCFVVCCVSRTIPELYCRDALLDAFVRTDCMKLVESLQLSMM
jgi:hypothetical protein